MTFWNPSFLTVAILNCGYTTAGIDQLVATIRSSLKQHNAAGADRDGTERELLHSSASAHPNTKPTFAPLPSTMPRLPPGYVIRDAILQSVVKVLLATNSADVDPLLRRTSATAGLLLTECTVHGMGGSGKTVVASAVCADKRVRSRFDVICFYVASQQSDAMTALGLIYFQLTGKEFDASVMQIPMAIERAKAAARGKDVLLVVDDAWSMDALTPLLILDDSTSSALLVTTRVYNLVPNAVELQLALLTPTDAVALIREVANSKKRPEEAPTKHELAAAKACGYLPLVLAIAGGMLSEVRGEVDAAFVELLQEDRGEVLREGELGDQHVAIEDRIIGSSLRGLMAGAKDKEKVERLFSYFACFAEDVRVPGGVLDLLAPMIAGKDTKRPALKVRSWLGSLLNSTLVMGSYSDGIYMHDIVRHYVISRRSKEELEMMQLAVVNTLISTQPEAGLIQLIETKLGSPEQYIALQLSYHMKGCGTNDEQLDEWLTLDNTFQNFVVCTVLCICVGFLDEVDYA
jgi:hypothetical protein